MKNGRPFAIMSNMKLFGFKKLSRMTNMFKTIPLFVDIKRELGFSQAELKKQPP